MKDIPDRTWVKCAYCSTWWADPSQLDDLAKHIQRHHPKPPSGETREHE